MDEAIQAETTVAYCGFKWYNKGDDREENCCLELGHAGDRCVSLSGGVFQLPNPALGKISLIWGLISVAAGAAMLAGGFLKRDVAMQAIGAISIGIAILVGYVFGRSMSRRRNILMRRMDASAPREAVPLCGNLWVRASKVTDEGLQAKCCLGEQHAGDCTASNGARRAGPDQRPAQALMLIGWIMGFLGAGLAGTLLRGGGVEDWALAALLVAGGAYVIVKARMLQARHSRPA